MRAFIAIILILFILNGFALREKALTPGQYMEFVQDEDNGLRVSKTIQGVSFSVQYEPYEYLLLKKSGVAASTDQKAVNDLRNYYYLILRISPSEGKSPLIEKQDNPTDYDRRLTYCNGQMQNDLILVDGADTLPCQMYHFERNFGLAPFNNFILGFRRDPNDPDLTKDKTLIFFDNLFQLGMVKLHIDSKDLKNIPKLKQ